MNTYTTDTSSDASWYSSGDYTIGIDIDTNKSERDSKLAIEEKVYGLIKRCKSPRGKALNLISGYLYCSYKQITDAIERLEKKGLIEKIENNRWAIKSKSFLDL